MRKLIQNILTSGIKRILTPEDRVRLYFLNSIMLMGSVMLTFFGIKNLLDGIWILGGATLSVVLIVMIVFILMRISQNFDLGRVFIPLLMFVFYQYLLISGGNENTGALWMTTFSLFSIFLLGGKWGGWLSILFFVVSTVLLFVPHLTALTVSFDFKSRLLGVYVIIMIYSLAFENIRQRAQKETEASRNLLLNEKAQTDGIMSNVQEGIFLIHKDLSISSQYSLKLEEIMGTTHMGGIFLIDLIRTMFPEKAVTALRDYLEMYFEDDPNLELLSDINPFDSIEAQRVGENGKRVLEFSFGLVNQKQGDPLVLCTVRDTTEQFLLNQKLKEEETRSEKQMRTLFQVIHVNPELMTQFLEDSHAEIDTVNSLLKENNKEPSHLLVDLFHSIHAIKGNAVLLGLQNFGEKAHRLEQKIVELKDIPFQWSYLLDITVELSNIQAELTEISLLIDKVMVFQGELSQNGEAKEDLLIMAVRKTLEKSGRELNRSIQAKTSEFIVPTNLPGNTRKDVKDILIQLARNAAYHGIEDPQDRRTTGKSEEGHITLKSSLQDNKWIITFEDDGRGLNMELIRSKIRGNPAFAQIDPEKATDSQLINCLFQPGFSTAEAASLNAGRGVGLSLVKDRTEALGGEIRLNSRPLKGCTFEVFIPLS